MIGPPSVSLSVATSSSERRMVSRALVLLATLELVGLLDELDVLEREADRGRADGEWGGTPAR
jgi:hypothetical protein